MAGVRRPAEPHTLSNRAAAVKQFVCKLEDLLKRYPDSEDLETCSPALSGRVQSVHPERTCLRRMASG